MLYYDFTAGNKEYKLKLDTKNIVLVEKKIGCNPLAIFGKGDTIPTVSTMVAILHASLQPYQHGITIDDAYTIFDRYLEDGHSVTDFINVIVEIYKVSGIINEQLVEKN